MIFLYFWVVHSIDVSSDFLFERNASACTIEEINQERQRMQFPTLFQIYLMTSFYEKREQREYRHHIRDFRVNLQCRDILHFLLILTCNPNNLSIQILFFTPSIENSIECDFILGYPFREITKHTCLRFNRIDIDGIVRRRTRDFLEDNALVDFNRLVVVHD